MKRRVAGSTGVSAGSTGRGSTGVKAPPGRQGSTGVTRLHRGQLHRGQTRDSGFMLKCFSIFLIRRSIFGF